MAEERGDFHVASSILDVGVFPFYPGDSGDSIGTLCRLLFTKSSNPSLSAHSPNFSILLKCQLIYLLKKKENYWNVLSLILITKLK